jgi:hypothetical protein
VQREPKIPTCSSSGLDCGKLLPAALTKIKKCKESHGSNHEKYIPLSVHFTWCARWLIGLMALGAGRAQRGDVKLMDLNRTAKSRLDNRLTVTMIRQFVHRLCVLCGQRFHLYGLAGCCCCTRSMLITVAGNFFRGNGTRHDLPAAVRFG